ncbi:MAG: MBL fold metallo-hydrolase [Candidatus Micrarchaeales archaeon]|nr:MBL fold metallo-hydrolase [Candidatus Micrarchaeales archaeon]
MLTYKIVSFVILAGDWMIRSSGLALSLDRKEKGATVDFISHAHTDHIASAKSSKNVIASKETIELLEEFRGIRINRIQLPKSVKLLDAGHILGSKQVAIEDENIGEKIIYTGDFQLQKSRACNSIEIEDADTVIVDSTYFDPDIKFEPREETESAIQFWTELKLMNGIVLFGTYSVGKAQELIAILNERGIVPLVSKKISAASEVYIKNGIRLDYASTTHKRDDYEQLIGGNFVGIIENNSMRSIGAGLNSRYGKRVFTAVATGMSTMMNFNTDVQFALSDHADFSQVIDYINATGAKHVFTYGQNAPLLAHSLEKAGYSALPYRGIETALNSITKIDLNKIS